MKTREKMPIICDLCSLFLKNLNSKCPAFAILGVLMVLIMQVTCYVPQDLHDDGASASLCPRQCSCPSPLAAICGDTPSTLPVTVTNLTLQGVAMAPLQRVQQLTVLQWTDSDLGHLHSHLFRNNPFLSFLNLSSNSIRTVSSESFFGLAHLQHLDLSSNYLTDLPYQIFSNLTQLRTLSLKDNKFDSLPFDVFTAIKGSLQAVDLSHNRLVFITSEFFHPAPLLEVINLNNNRLSILPSNALSNLPRLQTLQLSHNQLTDLPAQLFSKLYGLSYLNLSHNNLKRLLQITFKDMRNLRELNLSHNPIQSLENKQFESCTRMERLYLSNTSLQQLDEFQLQGLTNLQTLLLNDSTRLSRMSRFVFSSTPNLKVLSLAHTNMTSLPDSIFKLNLTDMDLTDTFLVCDCSLLWIVPYIQFTAQPFGVENAVCRVEGIPTYTNLIRTLRSLNCRPPSLIYSTSVKLYPLKGEAYLECNFRGSPPPSVTWVTPNLHVFHYTPDVNLPNIFSTHPKAHDENMQPLVDSSRFQLLENGTLRITDLHRSDAGAYICLGSNPLANVTATVYLYMDPVIMYNIKMYGLGFGVLVALALLLLTLAIQLLITLSKR